MPFQHDQATRDYVWLRYVVSSETPEEISEAEGGEPSASTIRRWIREGGWDRQRDLRSVSGRSLGLRMKAKISRWWDQWETRDDMPSAGESDAAYKLWKMASDLDDQVAVASAGLEALDGLAAHLAEHDPELADRVAPSLAVFARQLVARTEGA